MIREAMELHLEGLREEGFAHNRSRRAKPRWWRFGRGEARPRTSGGEVTHFKYRIQVGEEYTYRDSSYTVGLLVEWPKYSSRGERDGV